MDGAITPHELTLPANRLLEQHAPMMDRLNERMPALVKQTAVYQRRQSQFMDNLLTVNQPTPVRRLRQILAEISRASAALHEAEISLKKKQIKQRIYLRDAGQEGDELKSELLCIKAHAMMSQIEATLPVVGAAVRKIAAMIEQHDSIMASMGKAPGDHVSEREFEEQEEEFHIKTAFTQALTAARARGGSIDEGNHIYLQQIGISGAAAQFEIQSLLSAEVQIVAEGGTPGYDLVMAFLERVYLKFKGCSASLQESKGMLECSDFALLEAE